jgi:DNA-nicking Smr family endonuclease
MSRRPKGLTAEDRKLWSHVARSVTPLDASRRLEAEPEPPAADPPATVKKARPVKVEAAAPAAPPGPPPLAPLEKNLRRKLARGMVEVDDRIDLHGLTQEAAHRRLVAFLRRSQAAGLKVVIVITGKGAPKRVRPLIDDPWQPDPHAERGILRRMVPEWLRLPEMRALVIGFEEASIGHGGAGALYVRIRRA